VSRLTLQRAAAGAIMRAPRLTPRRSPVGRIRGLEDVS
jgi:hypothetical protein